MTNRYYCDDKERLVAYLYGETSDRERAEVEAHLAGCATCAEEVDDLRAVRVDLTAWQPPEADLGFRIVREPVTTSRRWWQVPAWAPVAMAAGLLLALAASVQVEYGNGAIVVRTDGRRQARTTSAAACDGHTGAARRAAGRPDRVDHDERGRRPRGAGVARVAASRRDVEHAHRVVGARLGRRRRVVDRVAFVKQVEGLIEASERRQQRELAFRLAQAMQDVDTQRRSDMVRIENGLGQIEGLTVQEGARQSRLINYLMRTSQER